MKKTYFTMFTHFSNVGNVKIFAGNMQTQNLFYMHIYRFLAVAVSKFSYGPDG